MNIKYLKHPVSKDEKAKYRAQGFTIVDLKFAPEGYEEPEQPKRKAAKQSNAKN